MGDQTTINNNKAHKRTIKTRIALNRQQGRITLQEFDHQALNNGGLASHHHERLYTLRVDVDERRRGMMDRGGEGDNEYRKRISPI